MKYILYPFSNLYKLGTFFRNYLYSSGTISSVYSPLFTVSIGNLSWGGTGKTPLCEWMLKWAHGNKLSPMVITRGYRGRPPFYPYVVDSKTSPLYSGDEPLMLYNNCPFAKIIVDQKRERGIYFGWKKFKPDIAILDDGFQYRKVKKHLDILVFSGDDITKNWNKIIPYGPFRESSSSINRAQILCVNSTGHRPKDLLVRINERLKPYRKPIYVFHVEIKKIISVHKKQKVSNSIDNYILVTGIGNPNRVLNSTVNFLNKHPKEFLAYSDHYIYKKKDWEFIWQVAKNKRAIVLCTPKDAVKLMKFAHKDLYTFELNISFETKMNTNEEFEELLGKAILEYKSSHGHV